MNGNTRSWGRKGKGTRTLKQFSFAGQLKQLCMETRLQSTGRPRAMDSYFIVPAINKIMAAAARSPSVRSMW